MAFRHSKEKHRRSLDDIFNDDRHGLLRDVVAKKVQSVSSIEISKFEDLNSFVDQIGRHPQSTGDMNEKLMHRRLQSFLKASELHETLRPLDRHNLLTIVQNQTVEKNEQAEILTDSREKESIENATSLEEIWASDAFSRIDFGDTSILEMKHVKPSEERNLPDEIAQRKQCADFFKFESVFRDVHEGLRLGEIKTQRFQQASQMREGDLFILQGVVCLIDEVGEHREDNFGNYDPRLRVIFENGTESNLLLRSLGKALYQDETGRRIIRGAQSVEDAFNNISHKDKRSGQIYFVATRSENPDLKKIPNLVKIGYTELTVEERTKNAENDTAFLESPITILAAIECFNLNPHRFESLIHGFLHAQRLVITLTGKDGKTYHPKEWFSVPLETAREVVKRIIDGTIVQFRMDNTTGRIVPKKKD